MNDAERGGSWEHDAIGKNYYHILGVATDASQDDIRKAYFKAAIECHPDKNPGDKAAEERFKRINEANQVLSDEKKRARYDQIRKQAQNPQQRPRQQTQQGGQPRNRGFDNFFGGGFSDFFNSIFGNEPQQHTETSSPELAKLRELQNSLMQAQTIDALIKAMDVWFQNAGNIRVDAIYPFKGFPLTVRSIQELIIQFKENKSRQPINEFFDMVVERNQSRLAAHIRKVINTPTSSSEPRKTATPQPQPETTQRETTRRPETFTKPSTEEERTAVENLLSNLTNAQTLEETIKALESWTSTYAKFSNTHTSAFYSFSPAELLAELKAFTSARFTRLDQSTHLKGFSPVAVGISRQVTAYLEKKNVVGRRPAETAAGGAKPAETTKAAEVPKPVDADHSGSPEINRLREALLKVTTLEEARKLLLGGSLLAELVSHKPLAMPSVLAATLNAVVNGTIKYDQAKFFKEAIAARGAKDISPVAKHLLQLAQSGELK